MKEIKSVNYKPLSGCPSNRRRYVGGIRTMALSCVAAANLLIHNDDMIAVKPLLTSDQIRNKVVELADRISRDYKGSEIVAVGILKGAFIFLADLIRSISVPVTVDFIGASSYIENSSSGEVTIYCDPQERLAGKHVLLVDDLIDTGISLNIVRERLLSQKPASLRICVLLDKQERRRVDVPVDYVGFKIPNVFIVGYGIDFEHQYRNLPYIAFIVQE